MEVGTERRVGHTFQPNRPDGLGVCLLCEGAEGSLPYSCPGKPISAFAQDAIYNAELEYFRGKWWRPL